MTLPTVAASGPIASEPFGLWGRAFRPFFLGLAIYGALAIPAWALVWIGALPAPTWLIPMWWHGHEMMFGFVAAAIAGFLLTASPVWSGGPALTGRPLALLVGLWVLARVAFAAAAFLPAWLVAVLDVAFLPAVAIAVVRTLWGSGQYRNYAVVGILVALAAANAAMHAEALGVVSGVAGRALRLAIDAMIVLVLVITGRITPAFTQNAFVRRGLDRTVRSRPWLNASAIGAAAAVALANLLVGRPDVCGLVALLAALAAAARLAGWQSWHTRGDPLLWSLHSGSAWIVAGFVLVGAANLGAAIPAVAGLHALTAGAMGGTIVAVITRVGLGHTGRPLQLGRGVVWCYALVHVAAACRVAAPLVAPGGQRALLVASGLAWALGFGIFAVRYWPILTTPRPDGRPG